jgi:hypothetical protein
MKLVGALSQVPSEQARVSPTSGVPVIAGETVQTGAAGSPITRVKVKSPEVPALSVAVMVTV